MTQLALEVVEDESTNAQLADYVEWATNEKRRTLAGPEWWNVFYALPEPRPDDSRDVVCPSCRARVGTFCKRPSGHTTKESHAARWDAFLAAAVLRATF